MKSVFLKTIALMLFFAAVAAGCKDPGEEPKITFTVTFDSNGGREVARQIVKAYSKVTEPQPAPVLGGYNFLGWYTNSRTFS